MKAANLAGTCSLCSLDISYLNQRCRERKERWDVFDDGFQMVHANSVSLSFETNMH